MKFTFTRLGELRLSHVDVEFVRTSHEDQLNVTIVLLRNACVVALKQRGAHFFAVRAPLQHELVLLAVHPNR